MRTGLATLALLALLWVCAPTQATAQSGLGTLSLKVAAGATELPVGPWGCFSSNHAGPCYLANRRLTPLFSFPIVVGQERAAVLPMGGRDASGKVRRTPEAVTLMRRAAGLSPVACRQDAIGVSPTAHVVAADPDSFLTTARIEFPAAPVSQEVAVRHDVQEEKLPAPAWPKASATVSWSPAFADNAAEGLIVRVSLTNPGPAPQKFFVDLFGGLDRPDPLYTTVDLAFAPDPGGRGITMRHAKFGGTFALFSSQGDYVARSFAVPQSVFDKTANIAPIAADSGGIEAQGAGRPTWALTRLSGISVEAGETRTVVLAVGLGHDAESALDSARTLLAVADDRRPATGALREGLFSIAGRYHEKARYRSGDAAIDGLMAQSLANVPFRDMRRIGIANREDGGLYRPGLGGWTALGWEEFRPDWAAAQLNAWFLTGMPAQRQIDRVVSVPPIDILAMWELYQQTHDRDMLEQFYPCAVWRFREFLESGRVHEDDWLFAWQSVKTPTTQTRAQSGARLIGEERGTEIAPVFAPDYSTYVVLAAKVLLASAKALDRPEYERASFILAIDRASQALGKGLWDPERGQFSARAGAGVKTARPDDHGAPVRAGLAGLLPFAIGPENLTPAQDLELLRRIAGPSEYLSPQGIRSVAVGSPEYRATERDRGGIPFGPQWILWKALLDRGDATHAAGLASRVLTAYAAAVGGGGGYPTWLNGDTGAGAGPLDSTGDSCSLIALYASYHRVGRISCGWNTALLDDHYDAAADTLRLVFRSLTSEPKGVLLCVMGKPGALYHATGGITGDFTADATGVIALPVPNDKTTQQVQIAANGAPR